MLEEGAIIFGQGWRRRGGSEGECVVRWQGAVTALAGRGPCLVAPGAESKAGLVVGRARERGHTSSSSLF